MVEFKRSSRCESAQCVEVAVGKDAVAIRNSEHPETQLRFTPEQWEKFIANVKAGEYRLP